MSAIALSQRQYEAAAEKIRSAIVDIGGMVESSTMAGSCGMMFTGYVIVVGSWLVVHSDEEAAKINAKLEQERKESGA